MIDITCFFHFVLKMTFVDVYLVQEISLELKVSKACLEDEFNLKMVSCRKH